MKKVLCGVFVFALCLMFSHEAHASGFAGWYKALDLVVQCKKNYPVSFACLRLRLEARTIILGRHIKNGGEISTRKKHVGFFETTANIKVIPYDGNEVILIFSGDTDYRDCRVWSGFDIAIVRMTNIIERPERIHITSYVPQGSSVGFARVDGTVTIVNEDSFHEVVKKSTSKTTFFSVQQ